MDRTDTSLGPSGPPDFLECSWIDFPEIRKELMALILVIEDNTMNMKHVIMLLQHARHTTLSAADAEAGVILARTGRT